MGLRRKVGPLVYRELGPFPVNWDDPDVLTTGTVLWTPRAGDRVMDIWAEVRVSFAGTGGFTETFPTIQTDNDLLANLNVGSPPTLGFGAAGAGTDIYTPSATGSADALSLASVAWLLANKSAVSALPARIKVASPIKCILTPNSGATMTAGRVEFFALVREAI